MGTRGCVAIGTPENWRGVYNHYDSYPTALGKEVWDKVQKEPELKAFSTTLLQFDDWRNYLAGGICPYCGKVASQPHTISGSIYGAEPGTIPDPEVKHHKHSDNSVEKDQLTHESSNPLFIEFAYVVDPEKGLFHVLAGKKPEENDKIVSNGSGHPGYKFVLLKTFELGNPEPDWSTIEKYSS